MNRLAIILILFIIISSSQVTTVNTEQANILQIEETQFELSETVLGAGYIGGSGPDMAWCVCSDDSGDFYIVGMTSSTDFPTVNPAYASFNSGIDMFVMKINNAGTQVIYSTYIGGDGDDRPESCAVDTSGNLYVTGLTDSTNFPTINALDSTPNGDYDAFVFKLNAAGNALVYSTYLGGSNDDEGTSIAVDAVGNAYVGGVTQSASFPMMNATDGIFSGGSDCFLTKLNSTGTGILFSTFIGGSNSEASETSLSVGTAGDVFIAGGTASSDFPTTGGSYDTTLSGYSDAYVMKISTTGAGIKYSTLLGGSDSENAYAMSVVNEDTLIVAGVTHSSDFPLESPAYDTSSGEGDGFVTKLDIVTNELDYSTYISGENGAYVRGMVLDDQGNAYITGSTTSSDFPMIDEIDHSIADSEAIVVSLSSDGTVTFSTYIGGSSSDSASSIAIDDDGVMIVIGNTQSSDLPGYPWLDGSLGGIGDGFFMLIATIDPTTTAGTDIDSDNDGLSDYDEVYVYGTDYLNNDTDSDGCPDGWEVARGLDPLEWTNATGQAQEYMIATLVPSVGGFVATFVILIATAVLGINAGPLKKLRGRILLLPAIIFLVMFFLFAPTTVYGTLDPGSNTVSRNGSEGTLSMTYTVLESHWYGNKTVVSVTYYSQYIDVYMTIYVTVRQGSTTIGTYELYMGAGYDGQEHTKSITLNLAPGTYEITRTYTYLDIFDQSVGAKWNSIQVAQEEVDGRNLDQKTWPGMRNIMMSVGFVLVIFGLGIKTDVIDRKFMKNQAAMLQE